MSEVVVGLVAPPSTSEQPASESPAVERDMRVAKAPIQDVGLELNVFPIDSQTAVAFRADHALGTQGPHNDQVAEALACKFKVAGDTHYSRNEFAEALAAYEAALDHARQGSAGANCYWACAKASLQVANSEQGDAKRASLNHALERCKGAQKFYMTAANSFACAALEIDMRRAKDGLVALAALT